MTRTRPHVVVIMADQFSAHMLDADGSRLRTPHLDALASDGARFERAYASFPLCVPSRMAMWTGRYPHSLGVADNTPDQRAAQHLRPAPLAHVMQQAGYRCAYAGKWHAPEPDVPEESGFQRLAPFGDHGLIDAATGFLRENSDSDEPFFLVVSIDDPHTICEFARDQPLYYGDVALPPTARMPNLPANFRPAPYEPEALRVEQQDARHMYGTSAYDEDDWRAYRWTYARLVERVDSYVGELCRAMTEYGLADDTLVIFTSDHGDGDAAHTWNQKTALFEEIVRVPFLVRWPARVQPGTVDRHSLLDVGIDLLPTLCDAVGAPPPADAPGVSWLTTLTGAAPSTPRSRVVLQTAFSQGGRIRTRGRAVVEERYKYVVYNWGRRREQLFDLHQDPGEQINLAVEDRFGTELERLRGELLQWAIREGDSTMLKRLRLPESTPESLRRDIYAVPY